MLKNANLDPENVRNGLSILHNLNFLTIVHISFNATFLTQNVGVLNISGFTTGLYELTPRLLPNSTFTLKLHWVTLVLFSIISTLSF